VSCVVCDKLAPGASGKSNAAWVDCDLAIESAKSKAETIDAAANHRFIANRLPQSCA